MRNFNYNIILLLISFYGQHADAQLASVIPKCLLGNSTCEELSYIAAKDYVIANGAAQFGVPSVNPLHLINVTVPFLDILKATLVEGDYFGIDTCKLLYYVTNATTFRKIAKIRCDRVDIRGRYTIAIDPGFSPLFGNIYGSGNVSILAEDWDYEFDFPFKFAKHNDGNIYTEPDFKSGTYVSKVLKKLTVSFDKIMVDKHNITKKVVSFINKNWELILDTIGQPFHEASVGFYYDVNEKIFLGVPATVFFIDDLEPLVSN